VTRPRIFLPFKPDTETELSLTGENYQYIKNVLRLAKGATLNLFDGTGVEYEASIQNIAAQHVTLTITAKKTVDIPDINISFAQSLAKGSKMDFIIQKASEIGATRVIPFQSSHSIPQIVKDKASLKKARWCKIAIEASKQSGRAYVPEITDILSFEKMLSCPHEEALKIILWENATKYGLKDILRSHHHQAKRFFFLAVGPEGGFSKEEIDKAIRLDFVPASLGKNILRVETASLVALAILQYEKGFLGNPEKVYGR